MSADQLSEERMEQRIDIWERSINSREFFNNTLVNYHCVITTDTGLKIKANLFPNKALIYIPTNTRRILNKLENLGLESDKRIDNCRSNNFFYIKWIENPQHIIVSIKTLSTKELSDPAEKAIYLSNEFKRLMKGKGKWSIEPAPKKMFSEHQDL